MSLQLCESSTSASSRYSRVTLKVHFRPVLLLPIYPFIIQKSIAKGSIKGDRIGPCFALEFNLKWPVTVLWQTYFCVLVQQFNDIDYFWIIYLKPVYCIRRLFCINLLNISFVIKTNIIPIQFMHSERSTS